MNFYQQAQVYGAIDPQILEASGTEELWPFYLEAKAGLAQVSVQRYLTDRELLKNSVYAPVPVNKLEDTPVAITHGWALVLVTDDPARQKVALN